jgi:hypothetical protein
MRDGRYLKDSECRAIIGSKPQTLVITSKFDAA